MINTYNWTYTLTNTFKIALNTSFMSYITHSYNLSLVFTYLIGIFTIMIKIVNTHHNEYKDRYKHSLLWGWFDA